MHWTRADGSGDTQVLLEGKNRIVPHGLSPDGKCWPITTSRPPATATYGPCLLIPAIQGRQSPVSPRRSCKHRRARRGPVFSPDGRNVAYFSNESGTYEIYVRPAPGPDGKPGPGKWQVSTAGGGVYPAWSSNGRELFFVALHDNRLMVTDYTATGDSFSSTKVRVWSDRQVRNVGSYLSYALAPDGKRVAVFPLPEATAEDKGAAHGTRGDVTAEA